MLYFFTRYSSIVMIIFKYFGIDISTFTDYERLVIFILCNILGFMILWFSISFLYKFFCRFFGGYR